MSFMFRSVLCLFLVPGGPHSVEHGDHESQDDQVEATSSAGVSTATSSSEMWKIFDEAEKVLLCEAWTVNKRLPFFVFTYVKGDDPRLV